MPGIRNIRRTHTLPAEPVEVCRFLFQMAVNQARSGEVIELYLPPAAEHARDVVERVAPLTLVVETNLSQSDI